MTLIVSSVPLRRRRMLALAAAACAASPFVQARAAAQGNGDLGRQVLARLDGLSGTVVLKIWAPATRTAPELLITRNTAQRLFVGSAIKAFVLCERMRQLDGPDILAHLTATDATGAVVPDELLTLDQTVWSADSASFNPPYLSGRVTERTTME